MMKKKYWKLTPILCFSILITACQSTHSVVNASTKTVTIYNLKGKEIKELVDPSIIQKLEINLSKKDRIFTKRRPTFEAKIIIKNSNTTINEWFYSSKGFATSANKKNTDIYRVYLPSIDLYLKANED